MYIRAAMILDSCILLLLLFTVVSLCGVREYYVRPTEPMTNCPSPCLTLNQYNNDPGHYFKSNSVFKFLPGTHNIERPVNLRDIQNMSLESFQDRSNNYPQIVVQFSSSIEVCESKSGIELCAALTFHNASNITVSKIAITVNTSNASGIVFVNVSNIHTYLITVYSLLTKTCPFGLLIYNAKSVQVNSMDVNNFIIGMSFQNCISAFINNTIVSNSSHHGIDIQSLNSTQIIRTITVYNEGSGISLLAVNNIFIRNTTSLQQEQWN